MSNEHVAHGRSLPPRKFAEGLASPPPGISPPNLKSPYTADVFEKLDDIRWDPHTPIPCFQSISL
jgi:hypothetical protein